MVSSKRVVQSLGLFWGLLCDQGVPWKKSPAHQRVQGALVEGQSVALVHTVRGVADREFHTAGVLLTFDR